MKWTIIFSLLVLVDARSTLLETARELERLSLKLEKELNKRSSEAAEGSVETKRGLLGSLEDSSDGDVMLDGRSVSDASSEEQLSLQEEERKYSESSAAKESLKDRGFMDSQELFEMKRAKSALAAVQALKMSKKEDKNKAQSILKLWSRDQKLEKAEETAASRYLAFEKKEMMKKELEKKKEEDKRDEAVLAAIQAMSKKEHNTKATSILKLWSRDQNLQKAEETAASKYLAFEKKEMMERELEKKKEEDKRDEAVLASINILRTAKKEEKANSVLDLWRKDKESIALKAATAKYEDYEKRMEKKGLTLNKKGQAVAGAKVIDMAKKEMEDIKRAKQNAKENFGPVMAVRRFEPIRLPVDKKAEDVRAREVAALKAEQVKRVHDEILKAHEARHMVADSQELEERRAAKVALAKKNAMAVNTLKRDDSKNKAGGELSENNGEKTINGAAREHADRVASVHQQIENLKNSNNKREKMADKKEVVNEDELINELRSLLQMIASH